MGDSLLSKIQPVVQKTAQAIADVIGLEVEVADCNFIRIAGTGKYHTQFGELMNAGFVYKHVMETKQLILIEHPGFHVLCEPCPNYRHCPEQTELAAPLVLHGKAVGAIGLVSFTPEQSKHFFQNKEWMIQFLTKMAELIVSNLSCVEQEEQSVKTAPNLNLASLEKETIRRALAEVKDEARKTDRTDKAASLLGISRATLYRKIREYNL
ncbi:hypothetical protein DWZ54_03820 [Mitsuokella sp. AF33-22]|nr:hypothetical protein DWZ54_03820 [Mitsuokella sp. AF33-22]